jgi:hypothetical protein
MYPFSYTSLKIIHDQKIEEALEHQRFYTGQETQRQRLLQTFGTFLARFATQSGRKKEKSPANMTQGWEVCEPVSHPMHTMRKGQRAN